MLLLAIYPNDIKNLLYILPVLSMLICAIYVRVLNRRHHAAESAQPTWKDIQIQSGTGGGAGGGGGAGRGSLAIDLLTQDDELINVRRIGLVIEYNDAALEAHAKKAKISQGKRCDKIEENF